VGKNSNKQVAGFLTQSGLTDKNCLKNMLTVGLLYCVVVYKPET